VVACNRLEVGGFRRFYHPFFREFVGIYRVFVDQDDEVSGLKIFQKVENGVEVLHKPFVVGGMGEQVHEALFPGEKAGRRMCHALLQRFRIFSFLERVDAGDDCGVDAYFGHDDPELGVERHDLASVRSNQGVEGDGDGGRKRFFRLFLLSDHLFYRVYIIGRLESCYRHEGRCDPAESQGDEPKADKTA